jgi:hypothetical protein
LNFWLGLGELKESRISIEKLGVTAFERSCLLKKNNSEIFLAFLSY